MIALENVSLEFLLNKAKESEKKYDWLQASVFYKKASRLALDKKDFLMSANLHEKTGFCFYRTAFQAQDNIEFRKHIKKAIREYQEEYKLLQEIKEENSQPRIKHSRALIFYTRSWIETNIKKRRKLLDQWWTLEKEVLSTYESINDDQAIGRTCLDLLEGSLYYRFWIYSEIPGSQEVLVKEGYDLSERAIQTFSKLDEQYELTRGYCFAIWHIGFGSFFLASKNETKTLHLKAMDYLNKALKISEKDADARLLSWLYLASCVAASSCKHDYVSAEKFINKSIKYAGITQDNFLIGYGKGLLCLMKLSLYRLVEDPDKQRETLEKTSKVSQEQINHSKIINHRHSMCIGYNNYSKALTNLASIEPDPKVKIAILEKTNTLLLKGTEELKDWKKVTGGFFGVLSLNYYLLSETVQKNEEKRNLLQKAKIYGEKRLDLQKERYFSAYHVQADSYYRLALIQSEIAIIDSNVSKQVVLLEKAITYLEKCIDLVEKDRQTRGESTWASGIDGLYYIKLGEILKQLHSFTGEKKTFDKALESCKKAITFFKSTDLPTYMAVSYWQSAQLHDQADEFQEAAKNYESAAQAYDIASKKIPQLKDFYSDHSLYMLAWSQIEQARYSHSLEYYGEAMLHYEKAADLHKSTGSWNYLTSNYSAWARMEEAESLSRNEQTKLAKNTFEKALQQFSKAEKSIKEKLEKMSSEEERDMIQRLLKASDLRRKYCQARILVEDAKLLDREGKHLESSKSYRKAAQNLGAIIDEIDFEAERKELEYLAILCHAWEKMASAEEATSSQTYLEAASLFEQAKEYCYTRKASLWALGTSSFCKGLAAGLRYKSSMDLKENTLAKRYVKDAASSYFEAGFANASEYAKATLRLFDAYVFMNQAESEVSPEKKTKQYQMAENLLQIAAGSFMKAKQPEKTAQVQRILSNVREEKALAANLSQVMQAPTIASSTSSFSAPSPTSEVSVGLEQFQHANVQANLIAGMKEVKVGESFCLSVEFVNAGKEPALLTRVEDFVPADFIVVKKPEIYRLEDTCLNMKGKQIAPLKLVEVKLVLQPSKKGVYQLKPMVHYLDEVGQNKSLQLKAIEIKVEEVTLADRVLTGTKELDSLLLGGIPNEYAVVLTGPPSDERELIISNFLEAGTKGGQTSFYVTTEAAGFENFLEKASFYLFLCNPKSKAKVPDLPNVYKLRGKTDLTNLNIALLKAYRNVGQSSNKRICLDLVSDVLVDYGVKTTRKWIAELITELGSKGFTTLAVLDSGMHTSEEANAIAYLFDGEISLYQTEDPLECKKSLRIKKLRNQEYIKNSICLVNLAKS